MTKKAKTEKELEEDWLFHFWYWVGMGRYWGWAAEIADEYVPEWAKIRRKKEWRDSPV